MATTYNYILLGSTFTGSGSASFVEQQSDPRELKAVLTVQSRRTKTYLFTSKSIDGVCSGMSLVDATSLADSISIHGGTDPELAGTSYGILRSITVPYIGGSPEEISLGSTSVTYANGTITLERLPDNTYTVRVEDVGEANQMTLLDA